MQPEDLNDNFLLFPAESECVFVAALSPLGVFVWVPEHPYSKKTINNTIVVLNIINIPSRMKRLIIILV